MPPDLTRRRDVGELIGAAWEIYRGNLAVVLTIAAAVVLTVDLILGIGLNQIGSRYQSNPGTPVSTIQVVAEAFVVTPLLNTAYTALLLDMSGGRAADTRRALTRAFEVFGPALWTVLLFALGVAAGLFLLVLPGLYLSIRWYFGTQSVVADGLSGVAALERSGELVRGNWWRVIVTILVINAVVVIPGLLVGLGADRAAKAADAQGVSFAISTAYQLLTVPFVAIAATLLFFDLRAARGVATASAGVGT